MPDKDNMIKKIADLVGQQTNQDRKNLVTSVGKEIAQTLLPVLNKIFEKSRIDREEITDAIREGFDGLNIEVPEASVDVNIPEIKVPEPRVTVNIPPIRIPEIKLPENKEMTGWLNLVGWDKSFLQSPLPVQLRDANGKPVSFPQNVTQMLGGGSGGGKMDYFTIKGFAQSAFAEITNADGRVKVELPAGGSGLTDTELRASSVPVAQASGAIWSVYAQDALSTVSATSLVNPDNRLRVSLETGGSGLTDAELRASEVPVSQVSGANWSTNITNADLDIRDLNVTQDELLVHQVSGSNWSVSVTNTVPVSATDLDIRDLANATDSVSAYQVSGAIWSTNVTNTVTVSGSLTSSVAVGPTPAGTADDGNAPVQVGGIARTANPTAVAGNDVVKSTHDDLGRQIVRPIQVRDLISTAYVQITNGTETTLKGALAGSFLDLVWVMASNNSDVAVSLDIRPVTAGNVVMNIQVPASGTAGIAPPVPLPQTDTGNNWTVDMGDITGTTLSVTALFSTEI